MTPSAIDIERVVREVIAEISAAHAGERDFASKQPSPPAPLPKREGRDALSLAPRPSPIAPNPKIPKSQNPSLTTSHSPLATNSSPGDLVIDAKVVTKNEILGRLDSVRRVIVQRGAIVTPAVQDELIRRGIAIECVKSKVQAETTRLVLVTMGTNFESEKLAAVLGREGFKVECASLNCIIAATEQLAAELAHPNTLGALLTRHTAAGLCLANRMPGVRAVGGVDAPSVAAATAAVGANLLVLDPKAGTFFQLKQMTSEFCRGGSRECPDLFKKKLA